MFWHWIAIYCFWRSFVFLQTLLSGDCLANASATVHPITHFATDVDRGGKATRFYAADADSCSDTPVDLDVVAYAGGP